MKKFFLLIPTFLLLFGCENSDGSLPEEEQELKSVTSEVILFNFTADTGNNTSRLQYEIQFTNPNPVAIRGFHVVTIDTDGITSSNIPTGTSACYQIEANAICTVRFDEQVSFDLGLIKSIKFISAEYNFDD